MSFTNAKWQPSAQEAIASGVVIMEEVKEIARNPLNQGFRTHGIDSLGLLATVTTTSEEADFSAKFARVDAVFVKTIEGANVTGAAIKDSVTSPTHPAKKLVTGITGSASSTYLLTIFGELLPNV